MLNAKMDVFGAAVWDATPVAELRVPSSTESQQTVLKALLETPLREQHRNPLDWVVSVIAHAIVVAALVIAPLLFTQVIDVHNLQLTYLVAPAPPAAPPPPAPAAAVQKMAPHKSVPLTPSKLMAPSVIPRKVVVVREPEAAPEVAGGVIGGVPGGVMGGVLSGIIGTAPPSAPAPVAPKAGE